MLLISYFALVLFLATLIGFSTFDSTKGTISKTLANKQKGVKKIQFVSSKLWLNTLIILLFALIIAVNFVLPESLNYTQYLIAGVFGAVTLGTLIGYFAVRKTK